MRYFWLVIALLIPACHAQQGTRIYWPATVRDWNGYSLAETKEVAAAFEDLNALDTWVRLAPLEQKSYPIILEISTNSHRAATLGTATQRFGNCVIAIRKDVFTDARLKIYLPAIVWHEVGHCAGLGHEAKGGYIMSAKVYPLHRFPQKSVNYFFEKLRKVTKR